MRLFKPADKVIFAETKIEDEFNSLNEENWLKKALRRAIADFRENAFCGERIRNERIPKIYVQKYGINNLSWYPLPEGWRLVYSVFSDDNKLIVLIVEYFNHKDYERRLGY